MGVVDRFWAAFWRRQAKHIPPRVVIQDNVILQVPQGGSGIYVGKDWRQDVPPAATHVGRKFRGRR